ncbi:MAG: substrate-binding domain-containing protein [Ruminococcus sp.]|nr:substrate-binding domain-containing protein [Ruminococcus sp.]
MCGQVIYPAAVLAKSKHTEEAKALLDYLRKAESSDIFAKVGFTPLS